MRVWEVLHNVIDVQPVEVAAECAPLRYPFLDALFCLCDSVWVAIVLSARRFFINQYMLLYAYTSHLYEDILPPGLS